MRATRLKKKHTNNEKTHVLKLVWFISIKNSNKQSIQPHWAY